MPGDQYKTAAENKTRLCPEPGGKSKKAAGQQIQVGKEDGDHNRKGKRRVIRKLPYNEKLKRQKPG